MIVRLDRLLGDGQRGANTRRQSGPGFDLLQVLAIVPNTPRSETRLTLRDIDGRQFVDLRVWRLAEDGEATPTLKGVTMTAAGAATLLAALDEWCSGAGAAPTGSDGSQG